MGIITAILSIVGAVIGAVAKAVVGFVTWWKDNVDWRVTVGLVVAVGLFAWGYQKGSGGGGVMPSGCSLREIACGCRPRVPRPPVTHTESGVVLSVEAPNRFTMSQGRRRERAVTVAYVVVQGDEGIELTQQLLPVGSPVTVTVKGRRLFGGDAPALEGLRRQESEEVESSEAAETPDSLGHEIVCDACNGTGTITSPDGGAMLEAQAAFCVWMDSHKMQCELCRDAHDACESDAYCEAAHAKWAELKAKVNNIPHEPSTDTCWVCGGSGTLIARDLEGRGPLTGVVVGPTGADIGLELCRKGFAQPTADAPEAYKAAKP